MYSPLLRCCLPFFWECRVEGNSVEEQKVLVQKGPEAATQQTVFGDFGVSFASTVAGRYTRFSSFEFLFPFCLSFVYFYVGFCCKHATAS